MSKRCFVAQPFDGGHYDSLYDEVFRHGIETAGFGAYRVDRDLSASIPIETIERKISEADACFVEMSENAPNVWFELRFAAAKEKPLCLVCSTTREHFPFDVRHRQIIRYPDQSTPSDFENLRASIAKRLAAVVMSDVSLKQNANTAKALAGSPVVSGLKGRELLALTIIFQAQYVGGINGWTLTQHMDRGGFDAATSAFAIKGLEQRGYICTSKEQDQYGEFRTDLYITSAGEDWLMEHQDELDLQWTQETSPSKLRQ